MARQGNWNKSLWRKLDNIKKLDVDNLAKDLDHQAKFTESMLEALTPQKYGGLVASRYSICEVEGDRVNCRVGYTQTPHWNLDPANPHQDDITNPQLLQYLIENVNDDGKAQALFAIQDWLEDFTFNCESICRDYFNKTVNGGK